MKLCIDWNHHSLCEISVILFISGMEITIFGKHWTSKYGKKRNKHRIEFFFIPELLVSKKNVLRKYIETSFGMWSHTKLILKASSSITSTLYESPYLVSLFLRIGNYDTWGCKGCWIL